MLRCARSARGAVRMALVRMALVRMALVRMALVRMALVRHAPVRGRQFVRHLRDVGRGDRPDLIDIDTVWQTT